MKVLRKGQDMMSIAQENKEAVLERIRAGRIDGARLSERDYVETIIKTMLEKGFWIHYTAQSPFVKLMEDFKKVRGGLERFGGV